MPKFLSYMEPVVEKRTIEVQGEDCFYYIVAKRTGDKIIVETISDVQGHICTASDLVKETRLTVPQVKKLIESAFRK